MDRHRRGFLKALLKSGCCLLATPLLSFAKPASKEEIFYRTSRLIVGNDGIDETLVPVFIKDCQDSFGQQTFDTFIQSMQSLETTESIQAYMQQDAQFATIIKYIVKQWYLGATRSANLTADERKHAYLQALAWKSYAAKPMGICQWNWREKPQL